MFYTVEQKDTLYKIARRFHMQAAELKKFNPTAKNVVSPGLRLFIPVLPEGIFRQGNVSEDITRIQEALAYMGCAVTVDGVFGPQTEDIITSLQRKMPELKANGEYDAPTRALLRHLLYSQYRIIKNPSDILALINKSNALPHTYEPPDLVLPNIPFKTEGAHNLLRAEAAKALENLIAKALKEGILLGGVSGYRSYSTQAKIYKGVWEKSHIEELRFHARPGESEHQSGLAMDIGSPNQSYELEQWFADTAEGMWLSKHAPDFGFVIRYPADKEEITGYPYEPWHFRYVGILAARQMTELNLALEEFK